MANSPARKGQGSISVNNNYLRISLPRRLFGGKQKFISLGLEDNKINRAKAELKLSEVRKDIAYDCFDFTLAKYQNKAEVLPEKKKGEIVEELINEFEKKYFFKRPKNRKSLYTFKQYLSLLNYHLAKYQNKALTEEIITKVIANTDSGSGARIGLVRALRVLCKEFNIEYNFRGLSNGYSPRERYIPDDKQIIETYNLIRQSVRKNSVDVIRAESWGWCFMVLATYGIRPHEIFAIDYELSFKKEDNYTLYLDGNITEGLKTGNRKVYPIKREWVEHFNLVDIKNKILVETKSHINIFSRCLGARIKKIKKRLDDNNPNKYLHFHIYALRHRYAIRAHELGFPPEAVARWMGHSLTMHIEEYHRHLQDDTDKIVFEIANEKISERQRIKENKPSYEELEEKIQLLEKDNARLQLKIREICSDFPDEMVA
jgi:integrase